jgi:5-formyltetrahydrofolate cyclo-ligase
VQAVKKSWQGKGRTMYTASVEANYIKLTANPKVDKYPMTTVNDKQLLRKEMRGIRKAFHNEQSVGAAEALSTKLLKLAIFSRKSIVSCFWPIQSEVNTIPLIESLHKDGHEICLPVVIGEAQPLLFRQWTPEVEMLEGAFKAMTPAEASPVLVPEIILSPLLAFDRKGYRLGYGGGFYDRSIEQISKAQSVIVIGLAYSAQEVETVPTETTDQKLDFLITEKEVISFK